MLSVALVSVVMEVGGTDVPSEVLVLRMSMLEGNLRPDLTVSPINSTGVVLKYWEKVGKRVLVLSAVMRPNVFLFKKIKNSSMPT